MRMPVAGALLILFAVVANAACAPADADTPHSPDAGAALADAAAAPDPRPDAGESRADAGPAQVDAGPGPVDAGEPAVSAVVPASAGASKGARVTIKGTSLLDVSGVRVGDLDATDVVAVDSTTVTAVFPPVPLAALGKKTVRVRLGTGRAVAAADAFEYLFDEDPIVFVHGYMRNGSDFDSLIARFRAAGYPANQLHAISFSDAYGSNVRAAQELEAFVADVRAKTGAARVDLVCHSMGGVSCRLFVAKRGGADVVRDLVSLAGSHHGAFMWWPVGDGGREMATTYACQGETPNDVQFVLNGCLTASGRTVTVDETPRGVEDGGDIAYLSLHSASDEVLVPVESPCLNMKRRGDCSDAVNVAMPGLRHLEFLTDPGVFEAVRRHVTARRRAE